MAKLMLSTALDRKLHRSLDGQHIQAKSNQASLEHQHRHQKHQRWRMKLALLMGHPALIRLEKRMALALRCS
jgi:hypothetical protein